MYILLAVILGIPLSIAIYVVFVVYDVLFGPMPEDRVRESMKRLLATQEYPPIPERAQDIEASRPWSRKSEDEIGWGREAKGTSWFAALSFISLM
jgi:hypothetical protein